MSKPDKKNKVLLNTNSLVGSPKTVRKDGVILNIKNRNIWIYQVYKELMGQVSSSEDKAVLRNVYCNAVKQTLKCTKGIFNTGSIKHEVYKLYITEECKEEVVLIYFSMWGQKKRK